VFLKPLSQEFGRSRAEVSLAFSLSILAMTGVGPLMRRVVDRLGARRVIVLSALIFGLGVISFDFLYASLSHFYAIYLVIGVAGSGTTPVPYSQVISRWFNKKRGLALGLAMTGIQLGAFITPPLAQALITAVGWRQAYLLLGLLAIGGTIPIVGPVLKEMPQVKGLLPDGETVAQAGTTKQGGWESGMNASEAWRTRTFGLIVSAFFLLSMSYHGIMISLCSYAD
jgi:MFS family permease